MQNIFFSFTAKKWKFFGVEEAPNEKGADGGASIEGAYVEGASIGASIGASVVEGASVGSITGVSISFSKNV